MNIRDLEQHVRDTENVYKYAKLRLSVMKNRLENAIAWYIRDNNLSFSYIEKLIKKDVTEEMNHYDIHRLIDEKLKKVTELA